MFNDNILNHSFISQLISIKLRRKSQQNIKVLVNKAAARTICEMHKV